jgi:hypothetical protein
MEESRRPSVPSRVVQTVEKFEQSRIDLGRTAGFERVGVNDLPRLDWTPHVVVLDDEHRALQAKDAELNVRRERQPELAFCECNGGVSLLVEGLLGQHRGDKGDRYPFGPPASFAHDNRVADEPELAVRE